MEGTSLTRCTRTSSTLEVTRSEDLATQQAVLKSFGAQRCTKYGKVIFFCSNLFTVFAHFVPAFAGGKEFASKYVAGQLLLGLDRDIYA